jgi:hypothetical protein
MAPLIVCNRAWKFTVLAGAANALREDNPRLALITRKRIAKSTQADTDRRVLPAGSPNGVVCLDIWFWGFWYWFEPVFVMVLTNFCWLGLLRDVLCEGHQSYELSIAPFTGVVKGVLNKFCSTTEIVLLGIFR